MADSSGTIFWGPMKNAIIATVGSVNSTLKKVEDARSGQKIEVTTQLQWEMAIMQQVLTASSNVTEGANSIIKSSLSMISR